MTSIKTNHRAFCCLHYEEKTIKEMAIKETINMTSGAVMYSRLKAMLNIDC